MITDRQLIDAGRYLLQQLDRGCFCEDCKIEDDCGGDASALMCAVFRHLIDLMGFVIVDEVEI